MIIAVDFDGTCVSHEFPYVGNDIGAVPILKRLADEGNKLILWTMRSDKNEISLDGPMPEKIDTSIDYLSQAIRWFADNGIPLYGIQRNPGQDRWTKSPKCYAELYIDDAALGCPLKYDESLSIRPFVDWERVEEILIEKGCLTNGEGI